MPALGGFCPFPLRFSPDKSSGWDSAQHARACNDLVAASYAAPFAVLRVQRSTNTIEFYNSRYGVGLSYVPTVVYSGGTETYTFTWSNSYSDKYGVSNLVVLHGGAARIQGGSRIRGITNLVDPRNITVKIVNIDGGAIALTGFTLVVY